MSACVYVATPPDHNTACKAPSKGCRNERATGSEEP